MDSEERVTAKVQPIWQRRALDAWLDDTAWANDPVTPTTEKETTQ